MKTNTSITIEDAILEAVDKMAESERRSRSSMIEVLLSRVVKVEESGGVREKDDDLFE